MVGATSWTLIPSLRLREDHDYPAGRSHRLLKRRRGAVCRIARHDRAPPVGESRVVGPEGGRQPTNLVARDGGHVDGAQVSEYESTGRPFRIAGHAADVGVPVLCSDGAVAHDDREPETTVETIPNPPGPVCPTVDAIKRRSCAGIVPPCAHAAAFARCQRSHTQAAVSGQAPTCMILLCDVHRHRPYVSSRAGSGTLQLASRPYFAVARIFVEREFGMVLPGNPPPDVPALRAHRRLGAVGVREVVAGMYSPQSGQRRRRCVVWSISVPHSLVVLGRP